MPRRSVLVLFLLVVGLVGCGGSSGSPTTPVTTPTPPGNSVTVVVFYDENQNGRADGDEVARIPDVEVNVGGRTARTEKGTGRAVVSGVPAGNQAAAVRNDTLPPFYAPGAPVTVQVPLGDGSQTFVPLLLPIGRNNPNQYLAFGDSITRGDGDTAGGYPARLQGRLRGHFGVANVRNRGADATNSYEALERLDRNLFNDAFALILYGTNDWNIQGCQSDPSLCPTVENLRIVVQRVKAAGTLPFIATLTPANPAINADRNKWIESINAGIKTMAAQEGAFLVDLYQAFQNQGGDLSRFFVDQVHPNAAGYDVMANGWFEAIAHGRSTPP
jgi:lysophospholipase L1-like esterase